MRLPAEIGTSGLVNMHHDNILRIFTFVPRGVKVLYKQLIAKFKRARFEIIVTIVTKAVVFW
jgi:hypothetical protein